MESAETEYDRKLEECIQYLKQRKVYDKLLVQMRDKYRSLGHFGGTVQLSGLSREECIQLGGFFQKDYTGKKTVRISAASMEKALENSRFFGLKWEAILRAYFQEEMVGKKEQRLLEQGQRERFFARILSVDPSNPGVRWLDEALQTKGEGYRLLMEHYRKQSERLEETLSLLMRAIPQLPVLTVPKEGEDNYELLAVFAAKTTGNPHFFDAGTLGEQLLLAFLRGWFPNVSGTADLRAEEKAEIFWKAGLLKDALSNHMLVYGIGGVRKDGKMHEGMDGFLRHREPLQLTLMTMRKLNRVFPQRGKTVYIVENPAVFAKLIEAWPETAILCGNGQIRLATWVLMNLFEDSVRFFYAGDYDPEGLLIAQRLKERYGDRLRLWKYQREFYEKYRSDVEIAEKSLKQLEHIHLQELQPVKQAMLCHKKAAYQEAMLEEYLKDEVF
ncbi:MAG: TIGR02679 domain-containing protein [Candidatus Gastranaerophilales bacterium]|nr:TIGR02679 domain-containing protein [Candidatus Gastranaerophilales bacterium]